MERSRRYLIRSASPLAAAQKTAFLAEVHDRMTECPYPEPLASFETGIKPEPSFEIPPGLEGRAIFSKTSYNFLHINGC